MQLELSGTLEFSIEQIRPQTDVSQIENYSHFSAVRLAKRHYERLGFLVLEGADFENNLVLYFYDNERLFCDEYIKVKLGKAHATTDVIGYSGQILNTVPEEAIKTLLSICRFCSYTGDPGFPDLIIMDAKNKTCLLKYVLFDELSASQKIFLLLSKLLGLETGIIKIVMEGNKEAVEIKPGGILALVLGERRSVNIMQGIEENITEAREKAAAENGMTPEASLRNSWRDELNYLVNEKNKNPLFLFDKWLKAGRVSSEELCSLIRFVSFNSRHDFGAYLKALENDAAFASISGKTEDAMKQKAEYMQEKFGIGQTKSKLLLNFF